MTDHDPPLTPEHEQEVRHLLATARHEGPMPPEVAARLDGMLADLAAEPRRQASVTNLHVRRRRVTGLLVAAAAVVVAGVGVDRLLAPAVGPTSQSESATADRQDTTDSGDAGTGRSPAEPDDAPLDVAEAPQPQSGRDVVRLRPDHLTDDAEEARASSEAAGGADGSAAGALAAACGSSAWGSGTFVPVRFGSLPAVLVLRRVSGDVQVADVYRCGDVEPVRSVTLPAP